MMGLRHFLAAVEPPLTVNSLVRDMFGPRPTDPTIAALAQRIGQVRDRVLSIPRATGVDARVAIAVSDGVFAMMGAFNKAVVGPLQKLGDAPANVKSAQILHELQDDLITSYGVYTAKYSPAVRAAKQNGEAVAIMPDDRFIAGSGAMLTKIQGATLTLADYAAQVDDIVAFQNSVLAVLRAIDDALNAIGHLLHRALNYSGLVKAAVIVGGSIIAVYLAGRYLGRPKLTR